ncbi:hypothetical protein MVEN_00914400 [Mycena venus]|uniref:Uncharacterized protein n=1 Tax=Mycena venus TaxID=2733690 RepID=A0A8H7D227_9AGAR|nr:hypothetical protein MVEN_00914400 [Mycena venus]
MSSPQASDALIPWNPHTDKTLIKSQENSRPQGRTLNRVYSSLGKVLETKANRAAYSLGLGPDNITQKIGSHFGTGENRLLQLRCLQESMPPILEKHCSKLIRYTLPKESAKTQCQAFKSIVELVTLFPGLRVHFLCDKCMNSALSTDTISAIWDRPPGPPDDTWAFWQSLAATCLSDTTISAIVEGSSIEQLTSYEEGGLSVTELLFIEYNCSTSNSRALCIRYLGGILNLPQNWLELGSMSSHFIKKLCCEMIQVLKDIGVDTYALGPITEQPDVPFDYEGVDFLAITVLSGIPNWLANRDQDDWANQPWYKAFHKFIQLLRQPRSEELLPHSSAFAAHTFEDIVLKTYQEVELDIIVDSEDIQEINSNAGIGTMEQEGHHKQHTSSADESNNSIGYDEDQSMENEEFHAMNTRTNSMNHKQGPSFSAQGYDSDTESKTSEIDLLDVSSQNKPDITSIFGHTQRHDSDSDSGDLQTLSSTLGHEDHKFNIKNSTMQLPNCHEVTSGQVDSFNSSNNPVWTTPSGSNIYATVPNETLSTHRHSVPLTPYTASMTQPPPKGKDSDSSQVFQVQMGTVEGVVPGTEFSAYAPNNIFLCTFIAQSVQIAQTILVRKAVQDAIIAIPCGSYAEVSDWLNEPMIMYVYIPVDFQYTTDLFPPTRTERTHKFTQALSMEKAHIIVRNDEDNIIIEPQTSTMQKCQCEIRVPLNGNSAYLADGMDSIAHFNYFLERSNDVEVNTLKGKFAFEMHCLQGDYPQRKPGKNMVRDGKVEFISDAHAKYGFTIRNTSPINLFPYLFYFDPDKFTIVSLYCPAHAHMVPPLPKGETVTIGMGSEPAFEFLSPPHEKLSSGFFKLFVTSVYIDLDWIKQQTSPFDTGVMSARAPALGRETLEHIPTWSALTVILTMTGQL